VCFKKVLFYRGRDYMKLRTLLWSTAMLMVVFLAIGCGSSGGSDAPVGTDSITIDSISPSTVNMGTGTTTFTIFVSYSLQTKDSGIINFGFQAGSGNYTLESNSHIVSKGTGSAFFTFPKTLTQTNTVHALLSEYPHPAPWSPLVYSQQTITVNP
jgi:hypothetical protein